MLFSVDQAFVRRDEKRAPLKTPAWEAILSPTHYKAFRKVLKYHNLKA